MWKWLVQKGQDSKVYMCIKEVKWDLQSADKNKTAYILAMASITRVFLFQNIKTLIEAIDNPYDQSNEDLITIYNKLEDIRNDERYKIQQTKKQLGMFGIELSKQVENHANISIRGLEIWMCTIGVGLAKNRFDDVSEIWQLLIESKSSLDEAYHRIMNALRKTENQTGMTNSMIKNLDFDSLKEICDYVPTVISLKPKF